MADVAKQRQSMMQSLALATNKRPVPAYKRALRICRIAFRFFSLVVRGLWKYQNLSPTEYQAAVKTYNSRLGISRQHDVNHVLRGLGATDKDIPSLCATAHYRDGAFLQLTHLVRMLRRLKFVVTKNKANGQTVEVPEYRDDTTSMMGASLTAFSPEASLRTPASLANMAMGSPTNGSFSSSLRRSASTLHREATTRDVLGTIAANRKLLSMEDLIVTEGVDSDIDEVESIDITKVTPPRASHESSRRGSQDASVQQKIDSQSSWAASVTIGAAKKVPTKVDLAAQLKAISDKHDGVMARKFKPRVNYNNVMMKQVESGAQSNMELKISMAIAPSKVAPERSQIVGIVHQRKVHEAMQLMREQRLLEFNGSKPDTANYATPLRGKSEASRYRDEASDPRPRSAASVTNKRSNHPAADRPPTRLQALGSPGGARTPADHTVVRPGSATGLATTVKRSEFGNSRPRTATPQGGRSAYEKEPSAIIHGPIYDYDGVPPRPISQFLKYSNQRKATGIRNPDLASRVMLSSDEVAKLKPEDQQLYKEIVRMVRFEEDDRNRRLVDGHVVSAVKPTDVNALYRGFQENIEALRKQVSATIKNTSEDVYDRNYFHRRLQRRTVMQIREERVQDTSYL